jgi:hypothetical protein
MKPEAVDVRAGSSFPTAVASHACLFPSQGSYSHSSFLAARDSSMFVHSLEVHELQLNPNERR